jgi:hypothetical protein
MTPTQFASFKYQHDGKGNRSQKRIWFACGCLGLALLALAVFGPIPGFVLLLVAVVAWLVTTRELMLGPRYLLCGTSILYYANVKRMTLSRAQGKLRLVCHDGQSFVLEREKFPTGARKPAKVAKNKAAKFDKVSGKIIEKVRKASANTDLSVA